jgi:uncharacterized protein
MIKIFTSSILQLPLSLIKNKAMSLKTQIDSDIKTAMLAKNKDELMALRSIKSMILLAETELAKKELLEFDVISRYLPKQLSEAEITVELKKIMEQVGAKGPQDMGKVMGTATKTLAGKADGKMISDLVKKLLAS